MVPSTFGPLLVALVLAVTRHDYRLAFASLAVPAVIMLSLLAVARVLYPRPGASLWGLGVGVVVFSIAAEFAGIPLILMVRRRTAT